MTTSVLQMQLVLSALDRVTGPCRKLAAELKKASGAVKETRRELRALEDKRKLISNFRELGNTMSATGAQLDRARARARALQQQLVATTNPHKQLREDYKAALREVKSLTAAQGRQGQQLKSLHAQLQQAGLDTRNLHNYNQQLESGISRLNHRLEEQRRLEASIARQNERMNQARERYGRQREIANSTAQSGVAMLGMGLGAAKLLKAPVAAFAEAEDAATSLKVAMMGAGEQVSSDFERINALAMRLGDRLPGTTANFQDMMTMLIRQGISVKTILGGLGEATAYLAVQLKMPTNEAAEFAAKLQDATRTSERDMMGLMDVIQRTFYAGVDPSNMLNAYAKISPALRTLRMEGLGGAQALAPLIAMLDQSQLVGESAGNALRKVFNLSMDAKRISKANAALAGTGVKLDFTNGRGEFGGLDKMFMQLQQLQGLARQKQLSVMKIVFGDDAETLQALDIMITKGRAGYDQMNAKLAAQASLQQRVNQQLGTMKNIWEAATGSATNALVTIGESIAPELKTLAEWLGQAAVSVQNFARAHPQLINVLLKFIGIFAVFMITLGSLALMVAAVIGPFAILQLAWATSAIKGGIMARTFGLIGRALTGLASTVVRVGILMLTNPLFLAIALLATAAFLIYRNWEPIKAFFINLWDGITARTAAFWQWLKDSFINAALAIAGLKDRFLAIGGQIIEGLWTGLTSRFEAIKQWFLSLGDKIPQWLRDKLGIRSPSRIFAEIGGHSMQGLADGLQGNQETPLSTLSSMSKRMTAAGAGLMMGLTGGAAAAAQGAAVKAPTPPAAGNHYEIHIHAAPGMDAQAIALEVRRQLDARDREKAAKKRSALYDPE